MAQQTDLPIVLVHWYDWLKWLLERLDHFPKNKRFIFGQRPADRGLNVLEVLVEAVRSRHKTALLARVKRDIEVLRWLLRLATDRGLLTARQYELNAQGLTECGRRVGGWLKHATERERTYPCIATTSCMSASARWITYLLRRVRPCGANAVHVLKQPFSWTRKKTLWCCTKH